MGGISSIDEFQGVFHLITIKVSFGRGFPEGQSVAGQPGGIGDGGEPNLDDLESLNPVVAGPQGVVGTVQTIVSRQLDGLSILPEMQQQILH